MLLFLNTSDEERLLRKLLLLGLYSESNCSSGGHRLIITFPLLVYCGWSVPCLQWMGHMRIQNPMIPVCSVVPFQPLTWCIPCASVSGLLSLQDVLLNSTQISHRQVPVSGDRKADGVYPWWFARRTAHRHGSLICLWFGDFNIRIILFWMKAVFQWDAYMEAIFQLNLVWAS